LARLKAAPSAQAGVALAASAARRMECSVNMRAAAAIGAPPTHDYLPPGCSTRVPNMITDPSAHLVPRVCLPQAHHGQLAADGLATAGGCTQQHAVVCVVQRVEGLQVGAQQGAQEHSNQQPEEPTQRKQYKARMYLAGKQWKGRVSSADRLPSPGTQAQAVSCRPAVTPLHPLHCSCRDTSPVSGWG
jgi:hypothetical protein